MERSILSYINREAKEHINRHHNYHNFLHIEYMRNQRRLVNAPDKVIKTREEWNVDRKFDPFYVLSRSKQISKSITKKILSGKYVPNSPYLKKIPKMGGGEREIAVYQLPDAAVSDKFYHDLLRKNKHRFSAFSYAYRNDRNLGYAIQDISYELRNSERIFVAEFDFSNFFGSIRHDYVIDQLDKNCFLISETEREIIQAFLLNYSENGIGIPQGLSLSLFLANLACWQLDRRLEDEGLRFARYADDTIIWTKDYSKICKAFDIIYQFSILTGIQINFSKSDGISLLQREGMRSEFSNNKIFIEFLGYKISVDSIGIREKSILKVKKQISYLLYKNLIQPIRTFPFNARNIPVAGKDRDFMVAIQQIRRYLYGNLSEVTIKKYMNGTYTRMKFKGLMSFYPLIDDEAQMKDLDRWLVRTILSILKKRKNLLFRGGQISSLFPFDLDETNIISSCKSQSVGGKKGLYQVPSFLRIYLAIKKGLRSDGIDKVVNSRTSYYE
ncbi:reverse transcriptase domain-containing protein [Arcticibacter tournemirensis]